MTKGRKTTYEERVEIVKYCIEHEMDYAQTAEKFQLAASARYFKLYTLISPISSGTVKETDCPE